MSLKDLLSKTETFVKLAMRRVAQDPLGGMTPEQLNSLPVDEVTERLFGKLPGSGTGNPSKHTTNEPAKNAPAKPAPQTQAKNDTLVPVTMLGAALPKEALDLLAPYKGKGLLNVTLQGRNLKVLYNSRGMHDTALQGKLQQVLPGYTVSVLGQTDFPAANY